MNELNHSTDEPLHQGIRSDDHRNAMDDEEYHTLASWLAALRTFTTSSRKILKKFNVTPQQYASLLEIRSCRDPNGLSVKALATRLLVSHNTAVQTINVLSSKGYATRARREIDRRIACLRLTEKGRTTLEQLVRAQRQEFQSIQPELLRIARKL